MENAGVDTVNCNYNNQLIPFVNDFSTPSLLYNDSKNGKRVLSNLDEELLSCSSFAISVAFITLSGLTPFLSTLDELNKKGIKGKILTTNYLSFSEPSALDKLSNLANIELKVFDTTKVEYGFHTKGYIFKRDETYRIIVGSSNMTASALSSNMEWNTLYSQSKDDKFTKQVCSEFEKLWNDENSRYYFDVRDEYREQYNAVKKQRAIALEENPVSIEKYNLTPNSMQKSFISSLKKTINTGADRALLISATGTGKTYAAAFAIRELGYKRILFVVHRTQLAEQTKKKFENVFSKTKTMGLLSGNDKDYDKDFIFATIQTLSRDEYLKKFTKDEFDCIILDEAHHSSAFSYKKIMEYFEPKLYLGMTATPDKRDDNIEGKNIYEIFNHTIAYEIRLKEAMEENLLCPFHYFGLTDLTISGTAGKDIKFNQLVAKERIDNILEKANYYGYSGDRVKGLIFCSRIEEALELSKLLNERGLRTVALYGQSSEDERKQAFERLAKEDGDDALDYILSVEILNEGVDIVEVNQVIMLRPTESPIVFIQQLGRGLRKNKEKKYVVILDFIGNYDKNFMIPVALSGDRSYNQDNIRKFVISGNSTIPGASTIHFDAIAKEKIFNSIDRIRGLKAIIRESYQNLKNKLNRIPRLEDFYIHNEIDPLVIIREYKSYPLFIECMENKQNTNLSENQKLILEYLSKTILSGIRPHELELLKELCIKQVISIEDFKNALEKTYFINDDNTSIYSSIKTLEGLFVSNEKEKEKYKNINIISSSDKTKIIGGSFLQEIKSIGEYEENIMDIVNVGLMRYKDIYMKKGNTRNNLVLYEKYSRKDISLIMNLDKDFSSTMYGMYKTGDDVFLFVTYHKESSKDGKEYISGKPDYADRFENQSVFLWDSQIGRDINSEYMGKVKNSQFKHLLIKKSDKENSFYYMGTFDILDIREDRKVNNNGKFQPICKVKIKMHNSVRDDIYLYLESNINEERMINAL